MSSHFPVSRQHGSALIVGLIMLMLMMLLAITTIDLGKSSLQIVGNMQLRNQVTAAAEAAIQDAVSTTRMFKAPSAVYLNPCGAPNRKCIDVNGDSTTDLQVDLIPAPRCIQSNPIKLGQLNIVARPADRDCQVFGGSEHFGDAGGSSGDSLCSNAMFEVTAVATDLAIASTVTITEGVNVQVATNDIAGTCP